MDWQLLPLFMTATLLLLITPGPVMAILAHNTLRDGRMAGLSTVIGVELGRLSALSVTLASLMLSGEFIPSLFRWLALAGTGYLLWLAIRALTLQHRSLSERSATSSGRPFIDGLAIAFSNPATLLFYAAFFPQFITPDHSITEQAVTLGALFLATSFTVEIILVISLARLRQFRFRGQSHIDSFAALGSAVIYISIAAVAVFGLMRLPA